MANLSTLTADFLSGIDSPFTASGSVTVADGLAHLPPSVFNVNDWLKAPLVSSPTVQFDSVYVKVSGTGAAEFYLILAASSDSGYGPRGAMLRRVGASVQAVQYEGTSMFASSGYVTYDPVTMAYWRMKAYGASGADVEYSADAVTWTRLHRWTGMPTSWSNWKNSAQFHVASRGSSGGEVLLDSINMIPAPPASDVLVEAEPGVSSAAAHAPEAAVRAEAPAGVSWGVAHAPDVLVVVPGYVEAPVALASGLLRVPDDVLAPEPNLIYALKAAAAATAPAPQFNERLNTSVYAPRMTGRVELLPPGEYVRIVAPAATVAASQRQPRRVGPALSVYAATVVQTEQNYGGAFAYYRFSDTNTTMTDVLGRHPGGWSAAPVTAPGAIVDDPNTALQFAGTGPVGGIGTLPPFNVERGVPWRKDGNTDPFAAQGLYYSGAGVSVWFKTVGGATRNQYILQYEAQGVANSPLRILMENGVLRAVFRNVVTSTDHPLDAPQALNDGAWHHVFVTKGRYLGDETSSGNTRIRMYVDGALAAQSTMAPGGALSGQVWVGGLNATSTNVRWEGWLDELAFFDYAPSPWEVLEHYNQGKKLAGLPLTFEPGPLEGSYGAPAPTIRKSPVVPLGEFWDDFSNGLVKWRDQKGTPVVVNGSLSLNGDDSITTADYFQAKDSSLMFRMDKLPFGLGTFYVELVNENELQPDWWMGGPNAFDSFRRHRRMGFYIHRAQVGGILRTRLVAFVEGQHFNGSNQRSNVIDYIPDDPNFPSPHRWLRLVVDAGVSGGATWEASSDGLVWTDFYDVHGGKINTVTNINEVTGEQEVHVRYEDADSFRIFDEDVNYEEQTQWRGVMRVRIRSVNTPSSDWRLDNVNVLPEGTGTNVHVEVPSGLVFTTSEVEYLLFKISPRLYSSAQDISIEQLLPMTVQGKMFVPPTPVQVKVLTLKGGARGLAPARAGDAVPIAVEVPHAAAQGRMLAEYAGVARPVQLDVLTAMADASMLAALGVRTDQSTPAPGATRRFRRVLTSVTRKVSLTVTQN